MIVKKLLLLLLVSSFGYASVFACTTFVLKADNGTLVFGRNFDFPAGMGHIEINPRGLQKVAFVRPPEKPLQWVSKYGSVTFNQMGREFPYGGMNEAGLVIEQMWLEKAQYPEPDARYGLAELQWVQYQLDNAATVQQVIQSDSFLRISYTSAATLHFLVADKSGSMATIEYLNGTMTVHQGRELPFPVLANCPYEVSLDYKKNKDTDKEYPPMVQNSSGRFSTAATMLWDYKNQNPVAYSFSILDSVSQEGSTQWSIVYDITKGEIHFRTMDNRNIRNLELVNIDFACGNNWLVADINSDVQNHPVFKTFSVRENLKLIQQLVSKVEFLQQIPGEAIHAMAGYPESVICDQ
ncbi:MAG TPA: linear amide C-N hydrolase [Bacteroidales bacterium]|nr:linear amide C-N hydrolase [Bacteroidales bacterium]